LARKQSQRGRGQSPTRGRGQQSGRGRFQLKKKKPTIHTSKNNHQEVVILEEEDLIKEVGVLLSDVIDAINLGIDLMSVQKTLPQVEEVQCCSG
jgi:hypothetical protein